MYDDYPNIQVKDSEKKRKFGANICAKFIYNFHLFNTDVNGTLKATTLNLKHTLTHIPSCLPHLHPN